ncbi:hypothetical protein SAMN04487968_11610 [Nocardioides terrae]|uniref:Uncharacterized protein n=1 Tax=Nocardioides terrae TaxID=574651 RepID=A0A1I1NBD3_9ACTN|nr:hypothetical protein [Nocardioides terrae]SFC95044.1 hypothetical protein SAMN04487968_11610 [Nocardioides terrae]
MATATATRARVFKVRGALKVEATDSLGTPVVVISDGCESVVIPAVAVVDLIAQLRRAAVHHDVTLVHPGVGVGA